MRMKRRPARLQNQLNVKRWQISSRQNEVRPSLRWPLKLLNIWRPPYKKEYNRVVLTKNFDIYVNNMFSLCKNASVISIMVNGGAAIALIKTDVNIYRESITIFSVGILFSIFITYTSYFFIYSYIRSIRSLYLKKGVDIDRLYIKKLSIFIFLCVISLGISVISFEIGMFKAIEAAGVNIYDVLIGMF